MSPPRLTFAQLLSVPVFAAVALACVALATRTGAVRFYGLVQVVFWETICIPLAMALTAVVLFRKGRPRDRLVASLLAASVLAGIIALIATGVETLWSIGAEFAAEGRTPVDLVALLVATAGGLIALREVLRVLWGRFLPGRCPRCGRRALYPDRDPEDSRRGAPAPRHVCDACNAVVRAGNAGPLGGEDVLERSDLRFPACIA